MALRPSISGPASFVFLPFRGPSAAELPTPCVFGHVPPASNALLRHVFAALQLLQLNGIIKLKDGVGLNATAKDVIKDQSHNAEIIELEAAQVSQHASEVDYMVLNGNYAMQAGYDVEKDALAYEKSDSDAAKTYVNVIVTTPDKKDNEGIKALVDVLKSDEITKFINDKYKGSVLPYDGEALN